MLSTPALTDTDLRGTELLRLAGLSVEFATAHGVVTAVRDLELSVARGECLGVVGESGAGKSQAFLAVMGVLGASARVSGSARFAGTELLGLSPGMLDDIRGGLIGMVFQDPMSSLTPHLTVGAQIAEVLMRHRHISRAAARSAASGLLERVHVSDPERRARQYPHELSGGMRQRVMIALALAGEPELLIADEPTTALDVTIQAQILALLGELMREREMALVLITHDLSAIASLADRVVVLESGAIVEEGPMAQVLRQPRAPATRALVQAALALGEAAPSSEAPQAPSLPALALEEVSVRFALGEGWLGPPAQLNALCDVSLSLGGGESLGIVGESGCGKSTLARAALALLPLSSGRIVWAGTELAALSAAQLRAQRREVQIVFQDPLASLDPRMTVAETVAEPLAVHEPELTRAERAAAVDAVLTRVGLFAELHGRYPHQLSGGQCQRVGLARALILKPVVLVCDEPLSALDAATQAQVVALLREVCTERGMSLLFISHNLALVRRLCQRVLVLYLGRLLELAAAEELYARPRHPYTRELLAAIPSIDPQAQRARGAPSLTGEPPSPLHPPSGCVYRTRCPHALMVCAERVPEWECAASGHYVACHRHRELA